MEGDPNVQDDGAPLLPSPPSPLREVSWIGSIALLYFIAARFGLMDAMAPVGIAPIRLPAGIFLSAILLTRRGLRAFLVLALGVTDFIAESLAGTPAPVGALYAVVLSGDAVLSSWLLERFAGHPITLRRPRELVAFLALAVGISNFAAALAAAAVLSRRAVPEGSGAPA